MTQINKPNKALLNFVQKIQMYRKALQIKIRKEHSVKVKQSFQNHIKLISLNTMAIQNSMIIWLQHVIVGNCKDMLWMIHFQMMRGRNWTKWKNKGNQIMDKSQWMFNHSSVSLILNRFLHWMAKDKTCNLLQSNQWKAPNRA